MSLGGGDLLAAASPGDQEALESGLRKGLISGLGLSGAAWGSGWASPSVPVCWGLVVPGEVSLLGLLTLSK